MNEDGLSVLKRGGAQIGNLMSGLYGLELVIVEPTVHPRLRILAMMNDEICCHVSESPVLFSNPVRLSSVACAAQRLNSADAEGGPLE